MAYSHNRIAFYRDRCRPPLTQTTLAQALGAHVNTVQRWEKDGVSSPAKLLQVTRLFVEQGAITHYDVALDFWERSGAHVFPPPPELRALFNAPVEESPLTLTAAEAQAQLRMLTASAPPEYAPLPPCSVMPLHRNALFVGREDILMRIAGILAYSSAVAITGLAGLGKTQLACEFVHRYGQCFAGGVFWLSFADANAVPSEVASGGGVGRMDVRPDFAKLSLDEQVRLVQSAWQSDVPRLLIFDNCEDEALLARWRPTTGGCRVLLTSRRSYWNAALNVQILPLPVLSRAESLVLLRKHRPDAELYDPTLHAIAADLGDLPLALHLAGSFLARYRYAVSLEDYLRQLRAAAPLQHPSLLGRDLSPTGHPQHVARSFALSYDKLDRADPTDVTALSLLARMACFAPGEPLPRTLLVDAYNNGNCGEAGRHGGTVLQVEDAIERLVNVGLLETGADDTLRMHRLLVSFTHTTMDTSLARADVERMMIAEANCRNDAGYLDRMLALQVHLRAVADAAKEREDADAADLCEVLGWQLVVLGSYQEPRAYLERSLAIREAVFGDCHAAVASSLNVLGLMIQFQGQFVQAEPYYKRAVAIWEQTLGPQHPQTITGYNNLGYVMVVEGKLAEAHPYLERALHLREHVLGVDHPDTARSLNNMGFLLLQQGEYEAARLYLERSLVRREALLGACHPAFVLTLTNLGRVLTQQRLYAEARVCFERALDIYDTLYSSPNIGPAETMRFLSVVLWAQGERAQAWRLARQALDTCMSAVGLDHSDTAHCLYHIGTLYDEQCDLENARSYYQQALPIYEISFAPQHRALQALRARLVEIERGGVVGRGERVTGRQGDKETG